MGGIAVDVVLLPDEAMTTQAIQVNRRLVGDQHQEIVLDRKTCLPHISLAMGCVDEKEIDAIREMLEGVARESTVSERKIVGVITPVNSRGETTSLFEVEKTGELQRLHERVMNEMDRFFAYNVTETMLYDDVVAETTLEWIRNYRRKASYERFSPHITIGYGEVPVALSFPIAFRASRLAVCHLGNHCTCRKVLVSVDLS